MEKTRVLVVGTGGIGSMAAYALEKGGLATVTAVMRSNYQAAVTNGIDLDSVQWGQVKAFKPSSIVNSIPDVSKDRTTVFDYVLVTTKNIPDVPPTVADLIAPAVTIGKTAIVLSQNGINIEKPLIARFPTNPIISSVAYTGATETAHAKIYNDDPDCQKIGAYFSPQVPTQIAHEAAKRYVHIYNPKGDLDVIYEPDVAKVRWRKIAYNGSFNPVASILRMDTPRMRMSQFLIEDLILPIIDEIRAIAKADGVILQDDLVHAVMHQDPNDTAFKPSMCQDLEKDNLMEVENLVGEPLREAERLGVPAPTLRIVYAIMKGLQLKIKTERAVGSKIRTWKPI